MPEATIFLWFPASVCVFFFLIKFYVSWSLSYCWAIRPPLSFSFPLPLLSALPLICPHSGFISSSARFFCLSLCLISPSVYPAAFLFHCLLAIFYPSDVLCLSLFPASPCLHHYVSLTCLSLSLSLCVCVRENECIAEGSSALFHYISVRLSFHLRQVTVPDPRHRLPTVPRNKHSKWFPARDFCLRWEWEKTKENTGFM